LASVYACVCSRANVHQITRAPSHSSSFHLLAAISYLYLHTSIPTRFLSARQLITYELRAAADLFREHVSLCVCVCVYGGREGGARSRRCIKAKARRYFMRVLFTKEWIGRRFIPPRNILSRISSLRYNAR
jgi:hypothetical protein